MRRGDVIAFVLTGLSLVLSLSCQGGGTEIAGGTGTGNPGGNVAVVIIADTGSDAPAVLSKSTAIPASVVPPLPVTDSAGMVFFVSSALISAPRICFMLAPGQDCAALVKGFSDLSCDSEGIVVEGPFTFDLMTGTSVPPLDSLLIPEASYAGLKLYLQGSGPNADSSSIGGAFDYEQESRAFLFALGKGMPAISRFVTETFAISHERPALVTITLDARRWLREVDLEPCLRDGSLPLNPQGNLIIAGPVGPGPCAGADLAISRAVLSSGAARVEF